MNTDYFTQLNSIRINKDDRISEADRRFCEAQQKACEEAKLSLMEMREQWSDVTRRQKEILEPVGSNNQLGYVRISHISEKDFTDKIEEIPKAFIKCLVEYFNNKYHTSLQSYLVKEALLPKEPARSYYDYKQEEDEEYHRRLQQLALHYNDVIDQLYVQLNGRSFTERAIDEIKEKCHQAAWSAYGNKPQYEVKNATISFTFYACNYESWLHNDRWSLQDEMRKVLRGVACFETGTPGQYPNSISFLLGYEDKHEPIISLSDCKTVVQLRMFKNHRTDVKFASPEFANQFADEYLGRVY